MSNPTNVNRVPSVRKRQLISAVEVELGVRVVRLAGELDSLNRDEVTRACVDCDESAVVVDLSQLTFMDCRGYGALFDAWNILDLRGVSLTIVDASGEPARLLELLGSEQRIRTSLTSHFNRRNP